MKKTLTILAFATTSLLTVNCKKNIEETETNPYEQFKGNWEGTYTVAVVNQTSTWNAVVGQEGELNGVLNYGTQNLTIKGNVSKTGQVDAIYTLNGNEIGKMTGVMSAKEASGNWENKSLGIHGTWKGTKK